MAIPLLAMPIVVISLKPYRWVELCPTPISRGSRMLMFLLLRRRSKGELDAALGSAAGGSSSALNVTAL